MQNFISHLLYKYVDTVAFTLHPLKLSVKCIIEQLTTVK